MKHIILTGGGTAGHVTPNIALIPALKEKGYEISYIGSYDGIEKKLIEELGIPFIFTTIARISVVPSFSSKIGSLYFFPVFAVGSVPSVV